MVVLMTTWCLAGIRCAVSGPRGRALSLVLGS